MKDSLIHLQTKQHKENVQEQTGQTAPEITVARNQVDYSEEDQLKMTRMLHNFKTNYHICKADQDFESFVQANGLFPVQEVQSPTNK